MGPAEDEEKVRPQVQVMHQLELKPMYFQSECSFQLEIPFPSETNLRLTARESPIYTFDLWECMGVRLVAHA